MKNRGLKLSIFLMFISICACGMFLFNNSPNVYASGTAMDCRYLLKGDSEVYRSNTVVGSIVGAGDYVVGDDNIELTATSYENFQLVGWQVVYNEQEGRTEFFDTSALSENAKEIVLTAIDDTDDDVDNPEEISARITFEKTKPSNNFYTSGKFILSKMFEDVTIRPIFDHIYFKVKINSLVEVSTHSNELLIGENKLFYEEAVALEGEVTKYTNSYIGIGTDYFYYGDVYSSNGEFYTQHTTLQDSPTTQSVDYSLGAFRLGESVEIDFDVDIDASDVKNSKNIDLKSVNVVGNSTMGLDIIGNTLTSNYYAFSKDSYLRTKDYQISFDVCSSSNYINTVNLGYHNLYLVDINILVDGSAEHDEQDDVLGTVTSLTNQITSNVSIYNFYSTISLEDLTFMAKTSSENNSKSLSVNAKQRITATIEGDVYNYYNLNTVDGQNLATLYYSNISQNLEINVDYSSVEYSIEFGFAKLDIDNAANQVLAKMDIDVPETLTLKRGSTLLTGGTEPSADIGEDKDVYLNTSTIEFYFKEGDEWVKDEDSVDLQTAGYQLVGFALSLNSEVQTTFSYQINRTKPQGAKIWLCLEKEEYSIILSNYNQVSIGTTKPLSWVVITRDNGMGSVSEILSTGGETPTLTGNSVTLSTLKIGLSERVEIDYELNNGFNVKFSLLSPDEIEALIDSGKTDQEMEEYYLLKFKVDQEFITNNIKDSSLTIYVYEEIIEYSITYFIKVETDETDSYVMADIDVEHDGSNSNINIVKYNLEGNVIVDPSLGEDISKIEITGLYLNDSLTLKSIGKEYQDNERYVFNWFMEGKSTLSFIEDGDNHNHLENIVKTRVIEVVYSIPVAKVLISIDEELQDNEYFTCSIVVKLNGVEVESLNPDLYEYVISVGETVTIEISGLNFGYEFEGYKVNDQASNPLTTNSFEYTTVLGTNDILLQFKRTIFRFYFAQHGAIVDGEELSGEYVEFDGFNYADLSVDKTEIAITKPLGYYVSLVKIGEDVINEVSVENNKLYRSASNNMIYNFKLEREDFILLVNTYGNEDEPSEIYMDLYYEIYKYDIEVAHKDSSGQNHSKDVPYLLVSVTYTHNSETNTIKFDHAIDTVKFEEIVPYGSTNVQINVLGQLQLGLVYYGWAYPNSGTPPMLVKLVSDSQHLEIGEVTENKSFLYLFEYDLYKIKLNFESDQGSPAIQIKDKNVDISKAEIKLFESLKIYANAIRSRGFKFKSISYNRVNYNTYIYDEAEWQNDYSELYVLDGHAYIKNNSNVYDGSKQYFEKEVITECFTENEMISFDKFVIREFEVVDKSVIFTIEYELLNLSMKHQTEEIGEKTITSPMIENLVHFDINDILELNVVATDANNETRQITDADAVTFYDVVNISIQINKNALESVSNARYDLSLGVELKSVQVAGKNAIVTKVENGVYAIEFNVGEYIPADGEEIFIIYSVEVQTKNILVTTVVGEDSVDFYDNVQMYASSIPPLGHPNIDSLNQPKLDTNWQFMAPITNIYIGLSPSYQELFNISGVRIYLTEYNNTSGKYDVVGKAIDEKTYQDYGIALTHSERVVGEQTVTDCQVKIGNVLYDFYIVFQIQPIISYNNGPRFEKLYSCGNDGSPVAQKLTIGSSNDSDIRIADSIASALEIKYQKVNPNGVLEGELRDDVDIVGEYKVTMSFKDNESFDWFDDIIVDENISLTISPRSVFVTYDVNAVAANQDKKTYDKLSWYDAHKILKFLRLTDGSDININYGQLMASGSKNFELDTTIIASHIASDTNGTEAWQANENLFYNLYVYNITLKESDFNKNFKLSTDSLTILNYIQIEKLAIDLTNVSVHSKVYDGTNKAELISAQNISVSSKMPGDDLIVDTSKLVVKFEDYSIGTNKTVFIDTTKALGGFDANNYKVNNVRKRGLTIYPYKLTARVNGLGTITVYNERGLTDKQYIDLIPLNATLSVKAIKPDTVEYAGIHGKISKHLKGNNEFAVGYSLSLVVNGLDQSLNNNLYVSIPRVRDVTGVYYLSGSKTGDLDYKTNKNLFVIDLNDVKEELNTIFITRTKILLKPWQIALIVITSVAAVAAGVLTFVIIRKRKFKSYSIHDKI